MSQSLNGAKSLFTSLRTLLAVSGVLAILTGIVLLIWPVGSAMAATAILAVYLLLAGLVSIGIGLFSSDKGGWSRVGYVLLGLLYIVAAVVAFANLGTATVTLAVVVAIFVGVAWIVDGIVALSLIGRGGSAVWTVLYALISIIAGVFILFSPLMAGLSLWVVLGIFLIVAGIAQIVRAITLTNDAKKISKAFRRA